jgi:hypothetical protein
MRGRQKGRRKEKIEWQTEKQYRNADRDSRWKKEIDTLREMQQRASKERGGIVMQTQEG